MCARKFFSLLEEPLPEEKREELCEEIMRAWKKNEIEKYIMIEYTIDHGLFVLQDLSAKLYTENFVQVYTQSWSKFIRPNYDRKITDNTPITNNEENTNMAESKKLKINLKKV